MRGKLPTEVFTPLTAIQEMAEYAALETYKSICDPACGDGNILIYVIEALKKEGLSEDEIIDRIFGYEIIQDNVDKCKERVSRHLPSVDISKINAHIQCRDTLTVPDWYTYDLIFMNPPYEKDLHKKFFLWALDHSKIMISIQPCQFLYKHKNLRSIDFKLQQAIENYVSTIDILNPNTLWPLNSFASPVAIFYILKKQNNNYPFSIVVNDMMTKDFYTVNSCSEITKNYTKMLQFSQKLDKLLKSYSSLDDHIESVPSKEWVVSLPKILGHISTTDNDIYNNIDFAILTPKSNTVIHKDQAKPNKQNFSFDTEIEAKNFLSYIKTDFARTCLYLYKHGLHIDNHVLEGVPYLDFKYIYTDDILFDMLGCKNPQVVQKFY